MKLIRHFVVLSLFFATTFQPLMAIQKPTQIPMETIDKQSSMAKAAKLKKNSLRFEEIVAELGSKTFIFVETYEYFEKNSKHYDYLTFKPETTSKVSKLRHCFYNEDTGIYCVVDQFRSSLEEGIAAAIPLIQSIAQITGRTLKDAPKENLKRQLNWLDSSVKSIASDKKCAYEKLNPQSKFDGWTHKVGSLVLLNRITRSFNFSELASITHGLGVIATPLAYLYKTLRADEVVDPLTLFYFLGASAATAAVMALANETSQFKERLKQNDEKRKKVKAAQESKEQDPVQFIEYHAQKDTGITAIDNVQDGVIVQEVLRQSTWLKSPIKFLEKGGSSSSSLLAYGEPGNGKAEIVKAISNMSGVDIVSVSARDLLSLKKESTSQLQNYLYIASLLAQKSPQKSIIVLFDEIDLGMQGADNSAALEALLTMLSGIRHGNPFVRTLFVFETNFANRLDERLLRPGRISTKLYVGPPTQSQREALLHLVLPNALKENRELILELAERTEGFSRAAIKQTVQSAIKGATYEDRAVQLQDFLNCIEKIKQTEFQKSNQIA